MTIENQKAMVDACLKATHNEWEAEFLDSLCVRLNTYNKELTPKQEPILNRIYKQRVTEGNAPSEPAAPKTYTCPTCRTVFDINGTVYGTSQPKPQPNPAVQPVQMTVDAPQTEYQPVEDDMPF